MPWEQRKGQRYYYRREYKNGKEVRTYFGRGPKAEQAAAEDQAKREAIKLARARRKERNEAQLYCRLVTEACIITARSFYNTDAVHIDRDGELRRKNIRTLRKQAQRGTYPRELQ